MRVRPSRFSAMLRRQGEMRLWVDEHQNLWLPWTGVLGDQWPAHPASGRVETDGLQFRLPIIPVPRPAPTTILVAPERWNPQSILAYIGAEPNNPWWLQDAGQQLTTLVSCTIVEQLVLQGVG